MTEVEKLYDKFFGKGLWEAQYKPHIVAFANKCIVADQENKEALKPSHNTGSLQCFNVLCPALWFTNQCTSSKGSECSALLTLRDVVTL